MPKKGKDGYYREDIELDRGPDRKRKRKTIRGKTLKEFNQNLAEAKRLYSKGITLDNITVYEWGERWRSVYKAKANKERQEHFERKLRLDIYPIVGNMPVKDVRASHLQELVNNSGSTKSSVKKVKEVIQQLFDAAETEGIIERNPARKLDLPNDLTAGLRRSLTYAECDIVWRVAQTHSVGIYVLTMLLCGLRRGECVGLKFEHIDFTKKCLTINNTIRFSTNQGREKGPKSIAGVRQVPIPDILVPYLIKMCKDKTVGEYVFTRVNGERTTEITVRRWWESFIRQCHLSAGAKTYRNKILVETSPFDDAITPHYLRHTYSTDIHAAGVHEYEQKRFMGHSSNDITDVYREISTESFNRAASLINSFFEVKYIKRPIISLFLGKLIMYTSTFKHEEK